ncbi:MAG: VWA domain-containing protein [Candidatus Tectomicrobia bacterium]
MGTAVLEAMGGRAAEVLGQKLMEFCHLLRAHGLGITAGRIIDTFRALKAVDFFRRGDFYTVLETNLISRMGDRELFYTLFMQFWRGPTWAMIPDPCLPGWEEGCELPPPMLQNTGLRLEPYESGKEPEEAQSQQTVELYSPVEVLSRKDFGKMSQQELAQVQRLITSMARQMATCLSRRKKARAKAHSIDPGRTMRHSLRYGGEVMQLLGRRPKVGKTKMVVLCDVSGSMDVYTTFLLQFLYGVQNGLRGVESIVFSTRLTRITSLLRRRNIAAALELISEMVQDWSGGTKIGMCIREFNDTMAANMLTSKSLVVIISDGWDTGDTSVLDAEMAKLRTRAFRIIWLNPLLGSPHYQPLCKGMHTALPYVHDFMPIHSVESLRQFGRLVASLT